MLRLSTIEPPTSQYASPTAMARKPDGSLRYCIDYRRLNSQMVFDAEPIPNANLVMFDAEMTKPLS